MFEERADECGAASHLGELRGVAIAALTLVLAGCALILTVRQEDLDAWVGMPVEALDTHSFFITLPLAKTITSSGIEIRNYPKKRNIGRCFGSGNINASGYMYGSS